MKKTISKTAPQCPFKYIGSTLKCRTLLISDAAATAGVIYESVTCTKH